MAHESRPPTRNAGYKKPGLTESRPLSTMLRLFRVLATLKIARIKAWRREPVEAD